MIRVCDTDKPCLHLVSKVRDAMNEKVKFDIYKKENCLKSQISCFYDVVHRILVDRWTKNNTPYIVYLTLYIQDIIVMHGYLRILQDVLHIGMEKFQLK